jgi:hypothetical protein
LILEAKDETFPRNLWSSVNFIRAGGLVVKTIAIIAEFSKALSHLRACESTQYSSIVIVKMNMGKPNWAERAQYFVNG